MTDEVLDKYSGNSIETYKAFFGYSLTQLEHSMRVFMKRPKESVAKISTTALEQLKAPEGAIPAKLASLPDRTLLTFLNPLEVSIVNLSLLALLDNEVEKETLTSN